MDIETPLKKATLFQGISSENLRSLAQHSHKKDFVKGRQVFSMGDDAHSFFIILAGWIKLYRVSKDGEETIIHVFGPGESFAEAAVFNTNQTYPVHAQAVDNTTLIEIPRNFFVQQIEEDTNFALSMLGAIAARQHYLVQQIEQITTRTAPQRIGAFLLRFCRKTKTGPNGEWVIDLPYDKSIISTRLNIKPETFSRALTKLKPYGVDVKDRKITISDIYKLLEFCEMSLQEVPC